MGWSWKNETDLMQRLNNVQNSEKFWNRDITTIVGFMTDREQLIAHVERNEALCDPH